MNSSKERAPFERSALLIVFYNIIVIAVLRLFRETVHPNKQIDASPVIQGLKNSVIPETQEQYFFLTAIVLTCSVFSLLLLTTNFKNKLKIRFSVILSLFMLLLTFYLFQVEEMGQYYLNYINLPLFLVMLCFLFFTLYKKNKLFLIPSWILPGLIIMGTTMVFAFRVNLISMINDDSLWSNHFNVFIYGITSLKDGGYQDYIPQYGYYGLYLQAFLIKFDPVLSLTLILSCLLLIGILALSFVGRKLIRNQWLMPFLIISLFLICGSHFLGTKTFDPYYQYYPLRFIFPALGVLVMWLTSATRHKISLALAQALFLFTCLTWNLDSGIPVVASILALQVVRVKNKYLDLKWFAIMFLLFLLLAGVFFLTISTPNVFKFQKLFLEIGFGMVPAPADLHPWHMIYALYLVTMIEVALKGLRAPRDVVKGYLSLIGIQLFSYYGGRSIDVVLVACSWPVFLLIYLQVDDLISAHSMISRPKFIETFLVSLITAPILMFCLYLIPTIQTGFEITIRKYKASLIKGVFEKKTEFIKKAGTRCELVSGHAGLYNYLLPSNSNWRGGSLSELILKTDYDEYLSYLNKRECLLLDTSSMLKLPNLKWLSDIEGLSVTKFYVP